MKVLIGVDGSDSSVAAVHKALALFGPCTPEFVLIRAVPRTVRSGLSAAEATEEELCADASAELEVVADVVRRSGCEVRTGLWHGDPRDVLEEVTRRVDPDVVVVGARGRGGLVGVLLGSVSSYAVQHFSTPVLVVRRTGDDDPPSTLKQ